MNCHVSYANCGRKKPRGSSEHAQETKRNSLVDYNWKGIFRSCNWAGACPQSDKLFTSWMPVHLRPASWTIRLFCTRLVHQLGKVELLVLHFLSLKKKPATEGSPKNSLAKRCSCINTVNSSERIRASSILFAKRLFLLRRQKSLF